MILRRIARPMLASVFIVSGFEALRDPQKRAEVAEPFLESTVGVLPDEVTSVIPTDPVTLVRVNGGVQLASGVLLASGKFPRFASAVLAASLAPTTFAGHPFWEESDPVARNMHRTHFLKNLSLMGGLLISAADTEGKPSLAWRGRRKADAALAALPLGAKAGTTAWDSLRDHAQESASVLGEKSSEAADLLKQDAHKLGERSAEAAEKVRDRAPEIAETARERSADFADKVRDRAPEIAETARERSADFADKVRDRAPEIAETARERSAELAELARERSAELAESAKELVSTAGDKADSAVADGKKRWRKARS
ncbi:DoxX family membrane protein [Gordonia otitidis]|uniref:DoxX family membrane protein n=1 Tax=Gordonia otitidis TaxID=249058 RepID=UPI001D153D19|nr:DoxX family membrane protein [Gordonia otitidis]UEA61701.1 DoxX family membrane protein [Gordonia otitidis]